MPGKSQVRSSCCAFLMIALAAVLLSVPASAGAAAPEAGDAVVFVSPGEGVEVEEKKPLLHCRVDVPDFTASLLVLLDGIDITGALELTAAGFEFRPVTTLPAGPHSLQVYVSTPGGERLERFFSFSNTYLVTSVTNGTAVYEQVLDKSEHMPQIPDRFVTANVGNTTTVARGNWSLGLTTNLRYVDSSKPLQPPEEKGLYLVDYLLTGKYQDDSLALLVEAGDLQVNETAYTVFGLARRGLKAAVETGTLSLLGFIVQSEQRYGSDGNSGLSFDSDAEIKGLSGGIKLFDEKLSLRAIYVDGSEEGSSFGIYSADPTRQEGDVLGFTLAGELFEGALNLSAEYDRSDFDVDADDDAGSDQDHAWNVQANGSLGQYSYQAIYEYVGPEYQVIGNQNLMRDREGGSATGRMQNQEHAVSVTASRYEDNVEEDGDLPQVETLSGAIDYSYNGIPNLPMGIFCQRVRHDSTMTPAGAREIDLVTDQLGARINYADGPWNLGLAANFSWQDDRTDIDYDTSSQVYTLTGAYYTQELSVAPGFAFNRSTDETTDVDTDTYTASIDLRGNLLQQRLTYELSGSFNRTRASDDSMEMDIINSGARVAYSFVNELGGFLTPSIGIRTNYNRTDDKVAGRDDDEFVLLLVLSANLGYVF